MPTSIPTTAPVGVPAFLEGSVVKLPVIIHTGLQPPMLAGGGAQPELGSTTSAATQDTMVDVPVIDVAALRPDAQQVELVAGLLAEVGSATAAELSADLRLPVVTLAAVLRLLERSGRARRVAGSWEHVDTGPRPPRRSWWVGGDWTG